MIDEENENFDQSPRNHSCHPHTDYQIFINNINYQSKIGENLYDSGYSKQILDRRFAFLDRIYDKKDFKIFINNINYKEIKRDKIYTKNKSDLKIAKVDKKRKATYEKKDKSEI
jgi:hypothetical protein